MSSRSSSLLVAGRCSGSRGARRGCACAGRAAAGAGAAAAGRGDDRRRPAADAGDALDQARHPATRPGGFAGSGRDRGLSCRHRAARSRVDRARRDERAAAHRGAFRRLGSRRFTVCGHFGTHRRGRAFAARDRWVGGVLRQDRLGIARPGVAQVGIVAGSAPVRRRTLPFRHQIGLDTGRDDRDAHLASELFVKGRAEDDVGVGVDFLADAVGRLIDLEQGHVGAAGDVDQDAAGALHRHVFEQRVVDRGLGGVDRATFAFGFAGAHHRLAHLAHHGADVGEVEVDEAGHYHQVGDAAHAGMQHVVGHLERVGERGALIGDAEQVLVRDDDQRIDVFLQFLDARFGEAHPVGCPRSGTAWSRRRPSGCRIRERRAR